MNKFITFRDTDNGGVLHYYILQRSYPHYQCIILDRPEKAVVGACPIMNHNLWVVFDGTILGAYLPSYKNVVDEIVSVMNEMAEWFYLNRVLAEPNRYKKWKITKHDTINA